jgi:hypothetical protein
VSDSFVADVASRLCRCVLLAVGIVGCSRDLFVRLAAIGTDQQAGNYVRRVSFLVTQETPVGLETIVARLTLVRLLLGVNRDVDFQAEVIGVSLRTKLTRETIFLPVCCVTVAI